MNKTQLEYTERSPYLKNKIIKKTASLGSGFFFFIGYCLPALVALSVFMFDYRDRILSVEHTITKHAQLVQDQEFMEKFEKDQLSSSGDRLFKKQEVELIKYFHGLNVKNRLAEAITNIPGKVERIWFTYASFITLMTLLPFAILAIRIGFRHNRLDITDEDRMGVITRDWWMKFMIASSMVIGWTYTVNPIGRGASTLYEYLNTTDIFSADTLPGYVASADIPLTVAGFLGWYLNLVTYFISKLYYNDVYGTRVYRFLIGKLLFTYGVALIISSMNISEGKVAIFLIGYFPLSAVSILKELGIKAAQGGVPEKGTLSELPAISRTQIIRLNEEGIDNIPSLAIHHGINDIKKHQRSIAPLMDFWVDYSRLYTIVGQMKFFDLKGICTTASEFMSIYNDPKYMKALSEAGIDNTKEVARLIYETYSFDPKIAQLGKNIEGIHQKKRSALNKNT